MADDFIRSHNAKPAFKGYNDYPFACCMSKNEAVVHGFPNQEEIKEGDVLSVDIGVELNGFIGDSAYTYAFGEMDAPILRLLAVTKKSLYLGIEKAIAGNRMGDISWAIEEFTNRQHGFGVVRELTGHGVGKSLHEKPEVPNYGKKGQGILLKEGLVIAIEPMINLGTHKIYVADDGWTIYSQDKKYSAHYEHSIAVKKSQADILSSFKEIEINEQANPNLNTAYYNILQPMESNP